MLLSCVAFQSFFNIFLLPCITFRVYDSNNCFMIYQWLIFQNRRKRFGVVKKNLKTQSKEKKKKDVNEKKNLRWFTIHVNSIPTPSVSMSRIIICLQRTLLINLKNISILFHNLTNSFIKNQL